jgi:hypothetical protein
MKIAVILLLPSLAFAQGPWPDPSAASAARERALRRIERQAAEAARTIRSVRRLRPGNLRAAQYNPIDIVKTKVVFRADEAAGTIAAVVDVTIKALESGVVKPVFTVTRLATLAIEDPDGNPLPFTYTTSSGAGLATVTLPAALAVGDERTLRFRNTGRPACTPSGGFVDCRVSEDIVYFVGPSWLPSKNADTYADLYTSGGVDFEITTPPGYVAATTSDRVAVDDQGDRLVHRFVGSFSDSAFPAFAYARYDVFTARTRDNKPVSTYIHSGSRDYGHAWAGICANIVDYYGDVYRPYLYPKHDALQITDDLGGGLGPQSATFYYASLFDDDPTRPLAEDMFSHEIAHSWWGGMVRMGDIISPWLNEGFAEYSSRLYGYHRWPASDEDYNYQLDFEIFRAFVTPDMETPLSSYHVYDDAFVYQLTTYNKGAHVLRMLQWYLGNEVFFAGMRLYATTNTWETSRTPVVVADFRNAMETVSGLDLATFFDTWVFSTGYPIYRWAAEYGRDGSRYTVRVRVRQVQETDWVYELPLEVTVWTGASEEPERFRLHFTDRVADSTFTVNAEPRAVKVDGSSWIFGAKEHELAGDVDSSNDVDGVDLLFVAWARGSHAMERDSNYYLDADFNRDGEVNDDDLAVVMDNFGQKGVVR